MIFGECKSFNAFKEKDIERMAPLPLIIPAQLLFLRHRRRSFQR